MPCSLTLSPLDSWVSVPCPLDSCGKSEEINNIHAVQEKHSYVIKNHSIPCLKSKIISFCSNNMSIVHLFHSTYVDTEKIGIGKIIAKIPSLCGSHGNMLTLHEHTGILCMRYTTSWFYTVDVGCPCHEHLGETACSDCVFLGKLDNGCYRLHQQHVLGNVHQHSVVEFDHQLFVCELQIVTGDLQPDL